MKETVNKVTESQVDSIIREGTLNVITMGEKTTLVEFTTKEGFVMVESSSCVDKANYNQEIGQSICLGRIRNKLWEYEGYCLQKALINGTKKSMVFNKATVDLTCNDELPLFSNAHTFSTEKMKGKTQSNYFYGDLTSDAAKLEEQLGVLANRVRNFKDENGEVMEYVADVVIIPCNRPKLENLMKKVIGSERTAGSNNNDINTQYGNWTLVVLDGWETTDDRFMVMSSEANENLLGNMFYNRVPLDITSDIDKHTRNYFWNGYCRFGVGFNTWKHIALAVNSSSAVSGATSLA